MRLAVCYQDVDPRRGGAETYVFDLCRGLLSAGHSVDLIASTWNASACPAGVNVQKIDVSGRTRIGRIWNFAQECERFLDLHHSDYDCSIGFLNTWGQDILIPQGGVRAASLAANARRFSSNAVALGYTLLKKANPRWWVYQAIERRQYDQARPTHFMAVSWMVHDHIRQYHKIASERIEVIPNAIDAHRLDVPNHEAVRKAFRARLGIGEEAVVGLFVAHNFKLKGLDPLLKALQLRARNPSHHSPVHLLVCGGGSLNRYRAVVRAAGLEETVHLVGFLDDVRDGFHGSDFFVLPSYYDPCSLVVFEALACGLPVITTRCNGAGEVIEPGLHGDVVDRPDDIKGLVQAIDSLCDHQARKQMSTRCMELGRVQSFDRHLGSLLKLIERVAQKKRQARKNGWKAVPAAPAALPHGRRASASPRTQ